MEEYYILKCLAVLMMVISLARAIGYACTKIGQPRIIGEMVSGVILGPTVFGYVFPEIHSWFFTSDVKSSLYLMSNLGLSLYMFLIGNEFQTNNLTKKVIRNSVVLTTSGFFLPLMLGIVLALILQDQLMPEGANLAYFAAFLGICLSTTAFPMIARVLHERGLYNTETGKIMILSGSMMDVVGWILLALMTTLLKANTITGGIVTFIGVFTLVGILYFCIKPLLNKLISSKENKINQNTFALVLMLILFCSAATDFIGMHSIFGGFILGMMMPNDNQFVYLLKEKMHDFTVVFFLPIFFTYSGINTTITPFNSANAWMLTFIILFAFGSKYLTVSLTSRTLGYSWRESSKIGALMNSRGLIELIVLNVGLTYGIISQDLFNMFVWMAIVTTALAMPIYNTSERIAIPKVARKVS
ncbi:cation:proton antiporter [Bacillus haynesii]|uniref:cation:proton antiporter n=1 Tax=Bacillus haynesii TaxID=1925021 RepID=UPI001593F27D|nr:cation:proton antiporter [Bacillus haynesii]NVB31980.1 hypothetical protein [Bacillus licheniformis]MCY7780515.1 cation:proton antiporter [Bacillus haynesii]MCY8578004.1 cation:proton antiporter [Bacillus haynesii]MCY8668972.1 cation:proton antiporter [Bacillus haynesii]MCY8671794.1 cation:proton antiporter [Bacillus haynesii]